MEIGGPFSPYEEHPSTSRWRKNAKIIAYFDIFLPIAYIIFKIVHVSLIFAPTDSPLPKPKEEALSVLIISTVLAVIYSLFELYFALGLLKSTNPKMDVHRALRKTSYWLCFQIFLFVSVIISGLLGVLYRRKELGDAILAFALAALHIIFMVVVRRFMRYLGYNSVEKMQRAISNMTFEQPSRQLSAHETPVASDNNNVDYTGDKEKGNSSKRPVSRNQEQLQPRTQSTDIRRAETMPVFHV